MVAVLAMLCTQSVAAQAITLDAWTDKAQYDPGEKGKLKISILNGMDNPVEIYNITIMFPWFLYDADKGEWVGNETIKGEPLATMTSAGTENDHYYKEVEFTIPRDGRAIMGDTIAIGVWTSEGLINGNADIVVAAPSWPMSIVDLDMWMTSLTVVIVICTIILAIVIFLSTRRPRAHRFVAPPPPPKPKAKAE